MNKNWPTREKDIKDARLIMEEYASERQSDSLGLFEIEVNQQEKRMDFCLSGWVILLAKYFFSEYGTDHGNFVTRQIISRCITQDETLH